MEPAPATIPVTPSVPVNPVPAPQPPPTPPPPPPPLTCPQCHATVRPADFFCANCGKNLKPKPLATTIETLVMYYVGSVILPPMGIIWGIKYVRQGDRTSRIHGAILIALTALEVVLLTVWTVNFISFINTQVNQQLNGLQGF